MNIVQSMNYSFLRGWFIEGERARERNQRFYNYRRDYVPSMSHSTPIPIISVHNIMPVIDTQVLQRKSTKFTRVSQMTIS